MFFNPLTNHYEISAKRTRRFSKKLKEHFDTIEQALDDCGLERLSEAKFGSGFMRGFIHSLNKSAKNEEKAQLSHSQYSDLIHLAGILCHSERDLANKHLEDFTSITADVRTTSLFQAIHHELNSIILILSKLHLAPKPVKFK